MTSGMSQCKILLGTFGELILWPRAFADSKLNAWNFRLNGALQAAEPCLRGRAL